ncbi:MAG: DUF4910 domain-containing protein [Chloroflexi bacterium]|nr:DUF4910 domain-containing protein [Chloroflexota bacterium]
MFEHILKVIRDEFSGLRAKEHVAAISQHHRIQASPGFRAAAEYCLAQLSAAGVDAEVLSFPASAKARYWTSRMFQEWEATEATLDLIEPEEKRTRLADFASLKTSLIQRSRAVKNLEAEVVLLEDGTKDEDYQGLDVRGKMVLTSGDVERVRWFAIEKRGAAGILFDGMRSTPPVRERMDLPDARQYTSFWYGPGDKECLGFVLSPRQGESLRALIKERRRKGEPPVKVRANIESRFWEGQTEVVTALVPGEGDEEIVVVAHLCHPQPSANDNASGSGAALEIARVLTKLIEQGTLPRPARSIRFLWVPEMTGTYAYLATQEKDLHRLIAGINLDMVGQNQDLCGSSFLIEQPPMSLPSFAPDLLERIRESLLTQAESHTGTGGYALFRHAVTPFSGGSDHYIFSDPTVGVPMPMLIQWPDKFYHTSEDTPDKTSPEMLAIVGILAATYAYFLACAGRNEAIWLGTEMVARYKARVARRVQDIVAEALAAKEEFALASQLEKLDREIGFLLDRECEALATLTRLAPDEDWLVTDLANEARCFTRHEIERAREVMQRRAADLGLSGLPPAPKREPDEWEVKAATMIVRRKYPGPISLTGELGRLSTEEREAWFELGESHRQTIRVLPTLLTYWCDGRRTLLEAMDLAELESGMRDPEVAVKYFEMTTRLGFTTIRG